MGWKKEVEGRRRRIRGVFLRISSMRICLNEDTYENMFKYAASLWSVLNRVEAVCFNCAKFINDFDVIQHNIGFDANHSLTINLFTMVGSCSY